MRSLPVLVLCLALLSTAARASQTETPPAAVPGSSVPFRSQPRAFALGPSLGALGGGLLIGAPAGVFMLGSGIGFGGPAYHLLAFPLLGPVAGVVLGDLISGHSPVGAWGGALLGSALGTASGALMFYSGQPGGLLYGLVGLALLPPLDAVLGRGLALMGESAPLASRTRSSVSWTLAPARLGQSGTGAVVMGWF